MATITRAGSTFSNVNTVGTQPWTNPASASSNDTVSATITASSAGTYCSNYLYAQNFGASVPLTASVNGWTWSVRRQASAALATRQVRDYTINTLIGGSISGNNKADTPSLWSTTACTITYGASNDTWGNGTVAPSSVNSASFGFAISCSMNRTTTVITGSVNYIELIVTYTDVSGSVSQSVRSMFMFGQGRR